MAKDPAGAEAFRALHQKGLLILPNAWDAGSARLIESLGAKAIATSSAAVAWAHGYADGNALPVPILAAAIAEITRLVRVPVSADIEGGYASEPAPVGDAVAAMIDAGAVGINIEDGTAGPDLLCAKIEQARRAAERAGVALFVNARADVYLRGLAPVEGRVAETLARAERYKAAGADGLFVPGVVGPAEIRAIASSAGLPLNVLARVALPPASELAALGVRRLSAGAALSEVAMATIAGRAADFLRTGDSGPLAEGAMDYGALNALMTAAPDAK